MQKSNNLRNVKLVIAYDGTNYFGWQKTNAGPSIENELQKVIEQITGEKISLQAASRTDAGVHAEGQVVNFFTSKENLNLSAFTFSMNRLLPKDIIVLHAAYMPQLFHPTLSCLGKEYRYFLCISSVQHPRHRLYSWHVPQKINLSLIKEATSLFIGKHDFATFCNAKTKDSYVDTIREITAFECVQLPENRLCFCIKGNHFLYKMVRNLIGTVVYVGRGKIPIETLPSILLSRHRPLAGVTAPAHGLFLQEVYPSAAPLST